MSFREFWPGYLQAHRDPRTRFLHLAGTLAGTALVFAGAALRRPWVALAGVAAGYGPAWLAHALIERNRPETLRAPFSSLAADFVMAFHVLRGTIDRELGHSPTRGVDRMFTVAPTALILALATGQAAPTALPSLPPTMMRVAMPTFAGAQSAIAVKANQPFQIHLRVTAGTGYTWRPQGPLPPGVTLLGVFQQARGKMMPGGPGEEVLVFRATDVGKMRLNLAYVRAWERGVKPSKTRSFALTVRR